MQRDTDGYGLAIEQYHRGHQAGEVLERDDGWIEVARGPRSYFAEFANWPARQRQASRYARGRILDVGCGAGRVALHFQKSGHEVVGIDVSLRAVTVCRERGVRDVRLLPVSKVSSRLGRFDTIVLYGGNFGLLGNPCRARWLLRRFHSITVPGGRILAESRNPYVAAAEVHRHYHRRNRERGRMAGQLRLRVRCGIASTPWFDWLIVSPAEMRKILAGTGWRIAALLSPKGPAYVAVLEKTHR